MLVSFAIEVAPLAAQKLFSIGPLAFTNSMLFGLITAIFVVTLFTRAANYSQLHPRSRLAFYIESIVDFLLNAIEDAFGDKKKARKFAPLLLTLFFFILASNISGLLPGVETITATVDGEHVSLLRSFTTDLNATLAMALLTIGTVQFFAFKELGAKQHIKHYFTVVSAKPWNPMNYVIGAIEIFGELLRIVTLSMRLFGVIYAGEVLLRAIDALAGNFGWAAMVPITFLELFFCIIQAYLFMMLSTVYLAMATTHPEEQHEAEKPIKAPMSSAAEGIQ